MSGRAAMGAARPRAHEGLGQAPAGVVPANPYARAKHAHAGSGNSKRGRGGLLSTVLPLVAVLLGLCLLFYPTVSNWLADQHHVESINQYDEATAQLNEEQRQAQLDAAVRYNESLVGDPVHDPFVPGSGYSVPANYSSVLNPSGDGVMGTLKIPKIDVKLPIYHGTGDESLLNGVGHIPVTPLPIGGKGWHSVLTGHRGLPSAELFTRLDELGEGDLVLVDVLGETHAYRVYATEVVLPDQLDSLASEDGRDLLTLVTCTPYGVNTHRLLVHCERTDYVPEEAEQQAGGSGWLSIDTIARGAGVAAGLAVLGVTVSAMRRHGRAEKGRAAGGRGRS